MSTEVDRKVVEMEIRNKSFLEGVKETIDWLGKFKESISNAIQSDAFQRGVTVVVAALALLKNKISDSFKFDNESQNLSDLQKDISKLNFDAITNGLQEASQGWSMWEAIAFSAIQNVTNRVVDAGIKIAKSLSIDQISAGWQKYDTITHSVQTIMAALPTKSIEEVTGYIDKLNWFTDETSYNLTDMTNNISKFTNAGIDLDKATNEMMGIATAAALAGANSQSASHAMAGFSKAMAAGYMTRLNWSWIETAHLDTLAFKQALIDAAYEQGELIKEGNKFYAKDGKNWVEVSATNLRDTLSARWLTSGAIEVTLAKYGDFADALEETYQKFNSGELGETFTTNEILKNIDKFKAGELDLQTLADTTGLSIEELRADFELLSSSEYEVGLKAFKAAQEAKTFAEAIEATKDAVSTGFMKSFELIFGNYEEAKILWTDMANWLYDLFAESGNARNDILRSWHKNGGYRLLMESLHNIMDLITNIRDIASDALSGFLPQITADGLIRFTGSLKDSTARLKNWASNVKEALDLTNADPEHAIRRVLNDEAASIESLNKRLSNGDISKDVADLEYEKLEKQISFKLVWINRWQEFRDIISSVSSAFSVLKTTLSALKDNVFVPIIERVSPIVSDIFFLFGAIGRRITDVADKLLGSGSIGDFFKSFGNKTLPIIDRVVDAIREFIGALTDLIDPVGDGPAKVPVFLKTLSDIFGTIFTTITNVAKRAFPILSNLIGYLFNGIKTIGESFGKYISNFSLDNILKGITGFLKVGIGAGALRIVKIIKTVLENFSVKNLKIAQPTFIKQISESISGFADKVGKAIDRLAGSAGAFKSFSISVLLLAAAFVAIAMVPQEDLWRAIGVMGAFVAVLLGMLALFKHFTAKSTASLLAASVGMVAIAGSILVLAVAFGIFALIPSRKITQAAEAMAISLGVIVAALTWLNFLRPARLIASAAALTIMAPSLIIMAAALGIFALIPARQLTKAVSSMATALLTMVAALTWLNFLKPVTMIASAAAMLILAPAILVMAAALGVLSLIKSTNLSNATRALFELLGIVALFTTLLGVLGPVQILAIASSLLVISAAIGVLTVVLVTLSLIPFEKLMLGIAGLAAALLVVVGSAALAGLVVPGLLALSAAFFAIAASTVVLGAGLLMVAAAMVIFAAGVNLLLLPFQGILSIITNGVAWISQSVGGLLVTLTEGIGGFFSWLGGKTTEGFSSFKEKIQGFFSGFVDTGEESGYQLGSMFNTGTLEGADIDGLTDQLNILLGEDADKLGLTAYDIGNMFSSNLEGGMLSYDFSGILDQIQNAIVNRTNLTGAAAEKAGSVIGKSIEHGAKTILKVKSPSRVFMELMDFVAMGIGIGADRNTAYISNIGSEMGAALVSSAEDALTPFNDLAPGISPVIDLSNVGSSSNLSFGATLTPGAARNLASVSADIRDQRESMNDYIDQAVSSAINGMKDELTFIVPLEVDGRQFAQSTARFTRSELNLIDRNNLRKGGLA